MEYRLLGGSGLKVPALSLGTATFGGGNDFFRAWGASDVHEATHLVDVALDAGVNLLDTADVYSDGLAEEITGQIIRGRRDRFLISTKSTFRLGDGPNDVGSSRHHLIHSVEASLKRLQTDYIDLYHLHGFDALTPVEEVLGTLAAYSRVHFTVVQDEGLLRPADVPIMICDATRLRRMCAWEPQIPLERTLLDLLNYWRDRVAAGTTPAAAG